MRIAIYSIGLACVKISFLEVASTRDGIWLPNTLKPNFVRYGIIDVVHQAPRWIAESPVYTTNTRIDLSTSVPREFLGPSNPVRQAMIYYHEWWILQTRSPMSLILSNVSCEIILAIILVERQGKPPCCPRL